MSVELAYEEPEWEHEDWQGEKCPAGCQPVWRKRTHRLRVPVPVTTDRSYGKWEWVKCPTCNGKGTVSVARVEREAPTCWVPRDVGLVIVDGRGATVERKSPRRAEVPALSPSELGLLVRWVSMRPDRRHHSKPSVLELAS